MTFYQDSGYNVFYVRTIRKGYQRISFDSLDLQCWIPGNCQGILIDEVTANDGNACLDLCKANEDCLWFTFNLEDNACVFLEDCQDVDLGCINCLSGERQCSSQKEGKVSWHDCHLALSQRVFHCFYLAQQQQKVYRYPIVN